MNSLYFDIFKRPAILPVIDIGTGLHAAKEVAKNVQTCVDCGADGLFLIDHFVRSPIFLLTICRATKEAHPSFWVRANVLNSNPDELFSDFRENGVDGRWIDSLGLSDSEMLSKYTMAYAKAANYQGLIFGGIAFKYIDADTPDRILSAQAERAAEIMGPAGVVTTSGTRTGSPPTIEKLRLIRESIGEAPLAVASGVSEKNIAEFRQYANAFLVKTSITDKSGLINPKSLSRLIQAVNR